MNVLSVVVSSKTMKVINLPSYECWCATSRYNGAEGRQGRRGEYNNNTIKIYFTECELLDMLSKDYLDFFNKNDNGVWDIDFATQKLVMFHKQDAQKFNRKRIKK